MAEYKLQGLSCANCAREMEEEIQKLDHGQDAKVLYNSSKLIISDKIALEKVEKILSSDGASILKEKDDHEGHDHSHEHSNGKRLLLFIGFLFLIYVVAMLTVTSCEGKDIVSTYKD